MDQNKFDWYKMENSIFVFNAMNTTNNSDEIVFDFFYTMNWWIRITYFVVVIILIRSMHYVMWYSTFDRL